MKIIKGKISSPVRALLNGPAGIGKSTFAAAWPNPLFVDCEDGTKNIDVSRTERPMSWSAINQIVEELTRDPMGFKTLVIDTADWADRLAVAHVCAIGDKDGEKKDIEAFGWGKGYAIVAEAWGKFLDKLSLLQDRQGMHILFIAHAALRRIELPDEIGAYDRWEMKLGKKANELIREWCDMCLFCNYKVVVVEQENKKRKAQGGKRTMWSQYHPCWDAKNRYGLPEEMPFEFKQLASIFTTAQTPVPVAPAATRVMTPAPPPAQTKPAEAGETIPMEFPAESPEKTQMLEQLKQLMIGSKTSVGDLDAELARKGVVPAGTHPRSYNEATIKRVIAGWSAITKNIASIKTSQQINTVHPATATERAV